MTIPCSSVERNSEEQLQTELDTPGDVALAAGVTEVGIAIVRNPELINRAKERSVEGVPRIGFKSNVFVFTKVRIFINRNIFVEVPESTNVLVLSWRIAELEGAWIGPATLVQQGIGVRITKVPRATRACLVRELGSIEQVSS